MPTPCDRLPLRGNKDVVVFERAAGRKLFLVAVDMKNELGSVADIAGRLERLRFNLIAGFISSPGQDNVGRCSFLGEAQDPSLTATRVKDELESSKSVVACKVREDHDGLLVDSLNFPLTWNNGDRAVMLRTEFFATMKGKVRALLGSGADTMLYELGYEHGLPSWRNLLATYKSKNAADLQELMNFYNAVGWGRVEVVSFAPEDRTATLRMRDNFECALVRGKGPSSHFVRGHLAGAFVNVTRGPVELEETSCVAAGGKFCEFQVRPSK